MTYPDAKRLALRDAANILSYSATPARCLEGADDERYQRAWSEVVDQACARAGFYCSSMGDLKATGSDD